VSARGPAPDLLPLTHTHALPSQVHMPTWHAPHDSSCPYRSHYVTLLLAFAAEEQMRQEAHKAARGKTWARGQSTPATSSHTPRRGGMARKRGGAPMHDTHTHTRTATHGRHARGAQCTLHTIETGDGESAPMESAPTCERPRAPCGSLFRASRTGAVPVAP